jgi:hypothetical protein
MSKQTNNNQSSATTDKKKPYEKPALLEYGDVREFTRGSGGSKPDPFGGDSFSG